MNWLYSNPYEKKNDYVYFGDIKGPDFHTQITWPIQLRTRIFVYTWIGRFNCISSTGYYTSNWYCPIRLLHYGAINHYIALGPYLFKNDWCWQVCGYNITFGIINTLQHDCFCHNYTEINSPRNHVIICKYLHAIKFATHFDLP